MIRAVCVRGVRIGEGSPKVIVPLTDGSPERLKERAGALGEHHADIVEWRVDFFEGLGDPSRVVATAREISALAGGRPLLFTCRTEEEGGEAGIPEEEYVRLNARIIEAGAADMVDLEYRFGPDALGGLIGSAHSRGMPVVVSSHDFSGTPEKDEIVSRLRRMQGLGADVCKVAVMPRSARDVLVLLDATLTMHERYADRPLITMAMGRLGLASRFFGGVFGSAATFGTAGAASAPGQPDAEELRRMLRLIHQGDQP
ncbi:MAG: type I 3-dehydroquinate dehydratase [Rubrobacteraceae bacterium]|uniref:type I 3-dehydroquinate dehydratase n=1 Tax=Rubrobacter naiadicus TaxID=1392641 RepID=UPI002362967A|nr:type I 3-dehydroquinate dehydratase [Rubrobacter naiadicus]MBX6764647.1 type I 3-dehydroquinate dehydratase [Rubrobacteraceae bacterium]MCL6439127.1 type I 3-dehydroquinate dehydratase [Rubrobacteraceae bacterium]